MSKYQEALSRIAKSFMNDNSDYRQYLDSKSAFNNDVEALQELVDNHNKLEVENKALKEENEGVILDLKFEKLTSQYLQMICGEQKEILDILKPYIPVRIVRDYDKYLMIIDGTAKEITKEQADLLKEWKEND